MRRILKRMLSVMLACVMLISITMTGYAADVGSAIVSISADNTSVVAGQSTLFTVTIEESPGIA